VAASHQRWWAVPAGANTPVGTRPWIPTPAFASSTHQQREQRPQCRRAIAAAAKLASAVSLAPKLYEQASELRLDETHSRAFFSPR
jgi:hypothetical protein